MREGRALRCLVTCLLGLLGYAPAEVGATPVAPKRTRGSNSQVVLPNNLHLADVDGDRKADFLQVAGPRLLVSRTNFKRTGILHAYFERDIRRVVTGDFKGIGRDYVCLAFDDGSLRCHKSSDGGGTELWWTWSQPDFISSTEDVVVADYDGDGRDDLLLYDRTTGAIRFHAIDRRLYFEPMANIAPGNLDSAQAPGLQLRAGTSTATAATTFSSTTAAAPCPATRRSPTTGPTRSGGRSRRSRG